MENLLDFDTDVLVIGTGPAGATTALALATYGVRVHMVARTNWLANTPRAHITNQRAVEVLRDLGIEKEALRSATPWDKMGDMLFTTSLAGPEIARLKAWGTGDDRHGDYVKGSPSPMFDLIQPLIEPIILNNAVERGASVTFNVEYLSHIQDEDGVTVTLKDCLSGRQYNIRARYLIGADGANSKVATDIELPMEGEVARAGTAYVMFNADLSRYVAHRPSILHWIVNPKASFGEIGLGLLRAVRPWDKWIAGWGFDMSKGEPDLSEEVMKNNIRILVGDPDLEFEIEMNSKWYVNQLYATEYSRGRVFCCGDSVHRHPPSSGLGLNTCVQDAFNIAWKLAFVIKGYSGSSLLETYSPERAPVGKQIVMRANQSRLDYGPLKSCFKDKAGKAPMEEVIGRLRSTTIEGVKARQNLQEALELKNTEFNAQGVEMNQRYKSNAVIFDPADGEELWEKDPVLYLQATTRPGAKIPHVWLVDKNGHKVSTLDVVGKGMFSLVTGLSGQAWVGVATELNLPYLRTVVIGEVGTEDPYYDWRRMSGIDEGGALLVRPDGYIAWRHIGSVMDIDEARVKLNGALKALLG